MKVNATVKPSQLSELLLAVAPVRPVYVLGQPGIGKSSLVEGFAKEVGLPCVSLLGTQLAAEDLIGVPQLVEKANRTVSRFAPPELIAQDEPFCLFLDELNGAREDVQKACYSLILDRRVGSYELPEGSVVVGAGNRTQDNAIVRTMSSALVNRMVLLEMESNTKDWLTWAHGSGIHPSVTQYIQQRPDHLCDAPPKTQQPFSTPRSWHVLSDVLNSNPDLGDEYLGIVASGCLTPSTAAAFKTFVRSLRHEWDLDKILKSEMGWPRDPGSGDILLFLAQSLRARLAKELPRDKKGLGGDTKVLVHRSKDLLTELCNINGEVAAVVVAEEEGKELPGWYLTEIIKDVPNIALARR